jgi:3-methyladenine DNA glycosylase AlkD
LARLRALASPTRAEQGRRYFKPTDDYTLLGVRVPEIRALEQELWADLRGAWGIGDGQACCDRLTRRKELEAKLLGIILLGRFKREYPRSLFQVVRRWLDEGRFPNWAAVDALAPTVLTPMIERYPNLLPQLVGWGASRHHWRRRAAVVALVLPARRGRHLDEAYALVERLLGDTEDLMHKACGWLLREAGKTDRARLERFLRMHGPAIPRTTLRYAIERLPESKRKRLLRETARKGAGRGGKRR